MAEMIKDLEITTLIHGGRGLGRHEGKAVFVPMTAPGDRIDCRVVKSKKRFVEAELCEVTLPSPARRQPPCPFFGVCGGCQWQHLSYPEQLRAKEQTFADLLVRSKVAAVEKILPIVAAPDEWAYRNRVQLKCHLSSNGLVVGFYRQGSHFVVDVDQCLLVSPHIQKALDHLRSELQDIPCAESISQIDLSCGDDGAVRIVVHSAGDAQSTLVMWLKDFAARHQLNACLRSGQGKKIDLVAGDRDLTVSVDQPALDLRYGPGGFVQVNSAQNRAMVAKMLEMLALDGSEHVLDLFCGMGNFSLPLARRAAKVTGVEGHAQSIDKARLNARANNIDNVVFIAADASEVLERFSATDAPDLVVLDPPRTGCFDTVKQLLQLKPQHILYVSCDPATLSRDLGPLVEGGYEVVSSQPFDLFPQTWHIESMTLLQRVTA